MSTNTDSAGGEDPLGRSKHLGRLAQIFYHRGATYSDLGTFLDLLFQGHILKERKGSKGFFVQGCRHGPPGEHHVYLHDPANAGVFNHERYRRGCLSYGKGEHKKNPGIVVHSICARAREYLEGIGKGEKLYRSANDEDFDPVSEEVLYGPSSSPRVGSSQVSEDPASDNSEEAQEQVALPASDLPTDDDDYGDVGFTLEDVEDILQQTEGVTEAANPEDGMDILMSEPEGFPSSQTSTGSQRSSTQMRVATLGYLWGFAARPRRLREELRRLRTRTDLYVLHLCGCGLPYRQEGRDTCPGCCEWSHLTLGSAAVNRNHAQYHATIKACPPASYPVLCREFHKGRDGEGIF